MTTEEEVMRLLRQADPDRHRAHAPSIVGADYLDALRTRSSNVDYFDAEPALTEPPTNHHRWLVGAGAAATVAVIAGGLVLAARDDDETRVVTEPGPAAEQPPVTEGPVTTPPAWATTPAVEDAGTRVGFIGLPPEGAAPSTPEDGELVVLIRWCVTSFWGLVPGSDEWISEPSAIDRLPPLAELYVLADGRLIWLKYENLPEGANRLSTGLLQQRLTPEGVELMRSEAHAAFSSGEPHRCGPRDYDTFYVPVGGGVEGKTMGGDNEHLARVMDPWSWLPATAWEDREITAYVPTTYLVRVTGELDQLTAQLPAAAAELIDTKVWDTQGHYNATFTTDEARALAAALDDAGLEQDGLSNAYQLDYQFEHHDQSRDTEVHIVFSVFDFEAMLREASEPPGGHDQPPQTEPSR